MNRFIPICLVAHFLSTKNSKRKHRETSRNDDHIARQLYIKGIENKKILIKA